MRRLGRRADEAADPEGPAALGQDQRGELCLLFAGWLILNSTGSSTAMRTMRNRSATGSLRGSGEAGKFSFARGADGVSG
jgi:hypothetical protein